MHIIMVCMVIKGGVNNVKRLLVTLTLICCLTSCSSEVQHIEEQQKPKSIVISEGDTQYVTTESNLDLIKTYLLSKPRRKQVKAHISDNFVFVPTMDGTTISVDKILHDIALGQKYIRVEDYYDNQTFSDDKVLQDLCERVNSFHITYTNGEVISANDCNFTLSENMAVLPDIESLNKRITEITLMYDTVGKFSTTMTDYNGRERVISGGSWGTLSDTLAEQEFIKDKVLALESVDDRYPVMKEECKETIPVKHVEVDIENQHLYLIDDNNNLIQESDIVTGLKNKRDTPKGIFKILEKRKEKDLRGPGYVSHVHRWLRLTWSGVGLHDATWRSKFGNTIYTYDGSHGCVNLPKNFAYDIYDKLEVGDCVIIY